MAVDGIELNPGSGGSTLAVETISGKEYQYVKLAFGSVDTVTIADASNGIPVDATGSGDVPITLDGETVAAAQSGTWNITNISGTISLPTGAATSALQTTGNGILTTIDSDTDAIKTATEAIQAAVEATLTVDVTGMVGQVDATNSSVTPLGIDAVFTGTATEILNFAHVMVNVFADEDSATDGLSVQWSPDGTNWDNTDVFTIPADTAKTYSFPAVSRYYRVVYTNGSTGQAVFRLESILKVGSQASSSHRVAESISGQDDAELTKAVITGESPGGPFVNVQVTNAGNLKVSLEEAEAGMEIPIKGTVAHDAADTGDAPVKMGGVATTSEPGAVADDDIVNAYFDATGHQHVKTDMVGSVVDANNSTTTPLGGGAKFEPANGTDLLGYSAVCITLTADVDSAASGMDFQFSPDDSNWDDVYHFTLDFSASATRRFQFPVTARYFRVSYTNGGGAQSAFRVQTILHTANQLTSIHSLSDDMSPDRSAQVVKAALFAQKAGSGDLTLVDATAGGNLKISVQEISDGLDIGAGNAGSETQRVSISTDDVNLSAIESDTNSMESNISTIEESIKTFGADTYSEGFTVGGIAGAVRNDDLATLVDQDTEIAPLQVDSEGALYVNAAASEPKRASGVAVGGTPGTDDIVDAVGSRKIRVLAISLMATSTTVNNIYLDNADHDLMFNEANPLPMSLDANGDTVAGYVLQYNPGGWFETNTVNEAVTLNSSSAQDIAWTITYIEVP